MFAKKNEKEEKNTTYSKTLDFKKKLDDRTKALEQSEFHVILSPYKIDRTDVLGGGHHFNILCVYVFFWTTRDKIV